MKPLRAPSACLNPPVPLPPLSVPPQPPLPAPCSHPGPKPVLAHRALELFVRESDHEFPSPPTCVHSSGAAGVGRSPRGRDVEAGWAWAVVGGPLHAPWLYERRDWPFREGHPTLLWAWGSGQPGALALPCHGRPRADQQPFQRSPGGRRTVGIWRATLWQVRGLPGRDVCPP